MWEDKKKKRAAEYRSLADHTRRVAGQMSLAQEREHLIGTAERLEKLADAMERECASTVAGPTPAPISGTAGNDTAEASAAAALLRRGGSAGEAAS